MITWYAKKALSPPSLGQWPPIFARWALIWVDHNHRVTWLICHVITLYSQKGASPMTISQRQWPLNLVELWVRKKGPHLLFQITCRSSDQVLFEKRHVSTNARPQVSQLEISNIEKFTNQKLFLYSKVINIWFTLIYTTL